MYLNPCFWTAICTEVSVPSASVHSIVTVFLLSFYIFLCGKLAHSLYVWHIRLLYLIQTIVPKYQYFCQYANDNVISKDLLQWYKSDVSLKTLCIFTHLWGKIHWRWKCDLWTRSPVSHSLSYPIGPVWNTRKWRMNLSCWKHEGLQTHLSPHVCKTQRNLWVPTSIAPSVT